MKKQKTFYWIATIIFGLQMFASAIPDIISADVAVQGMHHGLGYPVYFIPFIGVAKALGVIAILAPVSRRLKEWAYAGLFFDLIGATYSILSVGSPAGSIAFMILPIGFGVASYLLFIKRTAQPKVSFA